MDPQAQRRRIAVVSSSRADYGHLFWILKELQAAPDVDLRIIATAAHLSPQFGHTVDRFAIDGFELEAVTESLLDSASDVGMAKTIGVALLGLADLLARLRPDLLLLIADRYEMLAPAAAALALRIPIAHIEGGEVSEGAVDDAVRNALTKLAHLHFVPTEDARRRVLAMGEEAWRVHRVGAPSLDHLRRSELPDRASLEHRLGLDLAQPPCVVATHPVTLLADPCAEADALFAALQALKMPLVFCFPNADAGYASIVERARRLCATRADAVLFVNLDHRDYWGLLRCAGLMVGNSSSGIMETPSLALPCVNVGIRQQGRQRAANILDAPAEADAILRAIAQARSDAFRASLAGMRNPYGDGNAASAIVHTLRSVRLDDALRIKQALALDANAAAMGLHAFAHGD